MPLQCSGYSRAASPDSLSGLTNHRPRNHPAQLSLLEQSKLNVSAFRKLYIGQSTKYENFQLIFTPPSNISFIFVTILNVLLVIKLNGDLLSSNR